MMTIDLRLTPELVLAARNELPTIWFDVDNQMFRTTWLASHVRFVEIVTNTHASLALVFAYILTRDAQPKVH